jgi:hypothetical protein
MKIYVLLVALLLFVGCKHFESRHSTGTGTTVVCKPECTEQQINELAEPIF